MSLLLSVNTRFLMPLVSVSVCRARLCGFGPGEGEHRQQGGGWRQDLLLLQWASLGAGLWHRAHSGPGGPSLQGNQEMSQSCLSILPLSVPTLRKKTHLLIQTVMYDKGEWIWNSVSKFSWKLWFKSVVSEYLLMWNSSWTSTSRGDAYIES